MLRIALLGSLTVELDDGPIKVDTRKALALLSYLVMKGQTQSRAELMALLWSDYDETNARAALRRTLSVLKRALAGEGLVVSRDAVRLNTEQVMTDVTHYRELVAECSTHGHSTREECTDCIPLLTQAVALHRGDFLHGFSLRACAEFEEWQASQTEALRLDLDGMLAKLARACVAERHLQDAIEHSRRRLTIDPLNEAAHRALMSLYALTGDRAASLRQYRACVRMLQAELGVQPLAETTRLYQTILEDQGRPVELVQAAPSPPQTAPSQAVSELPFVGRDGELRALRQSLARCGQGTSTVFIEGEAGVGKTRLVSELTQLVASANGVALAARCYEGETDLAFGPIIALLQQAMALKDAKQRFASLDESSLVHVSRLVALPADLRLGLPSAAVLESPAAQSRFYWSLAECLVLAASGDSAGLVVIEDLHWCDEASLEFITYLVRRLAGRRILLVLTWRSEELPMGHQLQRLKIERQREGDAIQLSLSRLGAADVRQLVHTYRGEPDEDFATRLYQETEGLPFFLAQYLSDNGGAAGDDWQTPGGVGDLIRTRMSRLDDLERQVLGTAAIIGRAFSFDLLRESSGRPVDDVLIALEALVGHGLLRAEAGATVPELYDFTHEKLRGFVFDETGPARRQLLHRRIAEALVRAAGRRLGEVAAQAGHHFLAAGEQERASQCFMFAGEHAGAVRAFAEALLHYESAVACGFEPASEAHLQIGHLQTLAGAYGAALEAYQTSAALCAPERLPEVEHRIGGVYLRLGSWRLAEEHLAAALAGFQEQGRVGDTSRVQCDRALAAYRQGDLEGGLRRAREASELSRSGEDRVAAGQVENILGILASAKGDLLGAVSHFEASLELATAWNSSEARVAVLNNLANAQRRLVQLEEAEATAFLALEACVSLGDRHREAAIRNNLADLLRAMGREEESMTQLKLAVAIFAEVGSESGGAEPEVWKLVEW